MQTKRVFVCGIVQESNSFNPAYATLDDFIQYGIFEGDEILTSGKKCGMTVNGMLKILSDEQITPVPGVSTRAGSGGPLADSVVEWFLDKNINAIKQAGKLDGVLVSLHGATMSESSGDVCGDILEKIRQTVGEKVVISAAFDLHANITEKIIKNTDYISGYQMYPHLDLYETGIRAAQRVVEHLKGIKSKVARVEIPMIAPAHGYTTEKGSLFDLMSYAKDLKAQNKIVDYNIFQVQPWLDTEKMSSTIIITAKSEETAKTVAAELAKKEFAISHELLGTPLFDIADVIQKALDNKSSKPIVLVDSADSPNAGACGDSAAVLKALLPYRDKLSCAVAVTDIAAVDKAFELGVGATADFTLGGSIAPKLTSPVVVKNAVVKGLHDGTFYMHGPQERGQERNIGKTAVLKAGKILINVSYYGKCEGDKNFYSNFGIEPEFCDLVSVKACTSFRAGYEPISAEICNTNTPGAAGPVLTDMPYENRPVPMFPFEEITEEHISEAKCYR